MSTPHRRPADPRPPRAPIELTGDTLTIDDVVAVARAGAPVRVSTRALRRVREAREVVERALASGRTVYGLNTGLGSFYRYRIAPEQLRRFSFATVADQACSYGRPLPTDVVRAMMVTRANSMAKADIGKVLIGLGQAEVGGRLLPGKEALAAAGLAPIELAAKEALALISANGLTLGRGSLVLNDAADLVDSLQLAAALSLEGFAANLSIVHPGMAQLQPQIGLNTAAARLRELLQGSYLWQPGAARNLQDPLSFRCLPRTHGALYDALAHARASVESELNAASDNPLVLVEEDTIVSVGNFDVAALAMVFDLLRLVIANALRVANERVQKLLWHHFSGLPSALALQPGPSNGLKPMGRWCAALAAEARSLANPVSLDSSGRSPRGWRTTPAWRRSRFAEPPSSSRSLTASSPTS